MKRGERLRRRAEALHREVRTLYYAYRDPRVPWYSRVIILLTVAYALSPIDLIPDFIPVLGYVDDLLFIPLGIYLSLKSIPPQVLVECRKQASKPVKNARLRWVGLAIVVFGWLVVAAVVVGIALRYALRPRFPSP